MYDQGNMTRRTFLKTTAATAAAIALVDSVLRANDLPPIKPQPGNLYFDLLKTWCDGMLAHQITDPKDPALFGALMCPGCKTIHGRCYDAIYPLTYLTHATGDKKYLDAAMRLFTWSRNVEQPDGSWLNEVTGSTWKGITVFGSITLSETLKFHSSILDADFRKAMTERLDRAVGWIARTMNYHLSNINYPVTTSLALLLGGEVLNDDSHRAKAREFAHESLKYFTKNHLLFGEGKPLDAVTGKKCRAVDLGYNVEESLPSLAMYAIETGDKDVLDVVIAAMKAHMEFMLPDGAWDNSWGTRMPKWTWWGSRTSDGCQPGYALLASHDPAFAEVAWRNLKLLESCTHDGLLHGGPHYHLHGVPPCIHHTFPHAKALATVLDRNAASEPKHVQLPRESASGLKHFPEIGTWLVANGPWRATITEYDWIYGTAKDPVAGHPSGGALSLLYHTDLGPILAASMTEYKLVEAHNQQVHGDYPTMCLTPRIESTIDGKTYTSLSDTQAIVTAQKQDFKIAGRMLSADGKTPKSGDIRYQLAYAFSGESIKVSIVVEAPAGVNVRYVLPVISPKTEKIAIVDAKTKRITKPAGILEVKTDAPNGFARIDEQRVFNLVPGMECLPLVVPLAGGKEISIEIHAG